MRHIIICLNNLIVIVIVLLSLNGCASVEQTIYLGDAEVNAPISPPPTHININREVGDVTISPNFSMVTGNKQVNTSTDNSYKQTFKIDDETTYNAKAKNLQWNVSEYIFGVDLDIMVSEKFSVFGGFHFSSGSQKSMLGGSAGIGFHNYNQSPVMRLDLGLTIQKYDYLAVTIVHTKSSSIFGEGESWDIYDDKGTNVNINPFILLTINSNNEKGLINWFFPLGFFTQNLLGFDPGETDYTFLPTYFHRTVDQRTDLLAGFFYFNPGISVDLYPQIRLVFSAKLIKEVFKINDSNWFIFPSFQFDFNL